MERLFRKTWGLALFCLALIIAQHFGLISTAHAEEVKSTWKQVREGVWIQKIKTEMGQMTLTYTEHENTEWFSVTIPCVFIASRTYTVTWARGDDVGVTRVECTGRQNVEWSIYHLEVLFKNLPNNAPPAKPAEVFMEDYAYYA